MARDLETLLLWEDSGGTWQLLASRPHDVTVALLTCSGGEEMGRLHSSDPELIAHVRSAAPDD